MMTKTFFVNAKVFQSMLGTASKLNIKSDFSQIDHSLKHNENLTILMATTKNLIS